MSLNFKGTPMSDKQTLNTIQQVLRGVVVCLAATNRVNMVELATLLQAFSVNHDLDEEARLMLLDLSAGLDILGTAVGNKQN